MAKREFNITGASQGAAVNVKIIPLARQGEVVGLEPDGSVTVRVVSPPAGAAVNEELRELLAGVLNIRPSDVEIVAGLGDRRKLVAIYNVQAGDLERLLSDASSRG